MAVVNNKLSERGLGERWGSGIIQKEHHLRCPVLASFLPHLSGTFDALSIMVGVDVRTATMS